MELERTTSKIQENITSKCPDINKKFTLECDASNTGIGCVLKQSHDRIGFCSKKLTKSEETHSIVEKEFFLIIEGPQYFRKIIPGFKTLVYTDNANLKPHYKCKPIES